MLLRSAPVKLYWYQEASPDERAEVAAWIAVNDCSDIKIIGIDRAVVLAFASESRLHGWGTSEMRNHHDGVMGALAEAVARLRKMQVHGTGERGECG
jgi:hypothetical protein